MGQVNMYLPQGNYVDNPLFTGFLDGYNTMDALASLAFAIIIISNIRKLGIRKPSSIAVEILKSGFVCVIGMTVIYASLAYLGATSLGSVGHGDTSIVSRNSGICLLKNCHWFNYLLCRNV